jgi:YceI-like domain
MRKFLIALLALPCGCALPPKVLPPVAPSAPVAAPAGPYERYEILTSLVEVRVYRDGPMASLGHNHLISSASLAGTIDLRDPLTDSRFQLELPLDSLVVDDAAARAGAGAEFAKEIPPADREGTRRNMLGASVLDAALQPAIRLTVESLEGGPADLIARIRVGLRGEERIVTVPMSVELGDGQISVHARFTLHHADLGLTPFSVALGALRVRDDIDIDCRLLARRRPG